VGIAVETTVIGWRLPRVKQTEPAEAIAALAYRFSESHQCWPLLTHRLPMISACAPFRLTFRALPVLPSPQFPAGLLMLMRLRRLRRAPPLIWRLHEGQLRL
jgi:hypothetical protein